jgi:hypothetical protein
MRWKDYFLSVLGIVGLRALDLIITYHYTPDLQCEWNPLVSFLGASWSGFIIGQIVIVLFVAGLMFFYFNRKPTIVDQQDLSFNDFIYAYFYGKPRRWPMRMLSFPTNPERHLVFNGYIFMLITILISGFAIVHNLLLLGQVNFYIEFIARYHMVYFPVCFASIIMVSLYCFFTAEYSKYKQDCFVET